MNDVPLLLSDREAAKALGVSRRTIFSLQKSGTLPVVRIGRRVLYDPADLKKFVERQKTVDGIS